MRIFQSGKHVRRELSVTPHFYRNLRTPHCLISVPEIITPHVPCVSLYCEYQRRKNRFKQTLLTFSEGKHRAHTTTNTPSRMSLIVQRVSYLHMAFTYLAGDDYIPKVEVQTEKDKPQ